MNSSGLSDREEFLSQEVEALNDALTERNRQLQEALETIQVLETVIHKASVIAGHIPYLCSVLTEGSAELEQTALQMVQILVHRQV